MLNECFKDLLNLRASCCFMQLIVECLDVRVHAKASGSNGPFEPRRSEDSSSKEPVLRMDSRVSERWSQLTVTNMAQSDKVRRPNDRLKTLLSKTSKQTPDGKKLGHITHFQDPRSFRTH